MVKPTSDSTQERVRTALQKDKQPQNLKEQGAIGNLKQNVNIPQHRNQDR